MSTVAIGSLAAASAEVVKSGDLRISVLAQVKPFGLPRTGTAPIAVFVAGRIASTSGGVPPQLQRMRIEVNRRGLLRSQGLPTCPIAAIETASTERALALCSDALVGSGRFWATVVFPDQRPYPTRGRLLVFNGRRDGRPTLYAHIFTRTPFATSFVIAFAIRRVNHGVYGTELVASLPETLGSWGFVDRIKLTLRRRYRHHGKDLSYFNAGCPAIAETRFASFPLARVSFDFADHRQVRLTVTKTCKVER